VCGLGILLRLSLNSSTTFCFSLPSTGIIAMHHTPGIYALSQFWYSSNRKLIQHFTDKRYNPGR
jgi:hypothetical protein